MAPWCGWSQQAQRSRVLRQTYRGLPRGSRRAVDVYVSLGRGCFPGYRGYGAWHRYFLFGCWGWNLLDDDIPF